MGLYSNLKFFKKILTTNLGFFDPYELNFAITYKCNSRCTICNIWKEKSENELSLKEIEKIVEKIDFVHWVRLTGGEPFLRKDYIEIVKIFKKNLPNLFMLTTPTNGLLSDLIFEKVKEALGFFDKRYVITVSLDGPPKIHDKIRGVKGSWEKAIETYNKLKPLEEKNKNFKVFFGYTISPHNVGFFKKTVEEVKKITPDIEADDFHINLFQTSNIYYKNLNQKIDKNYIEQAEKEIEIILNMREKKDIISSIEDKYLKLGREYLKTGNIPIKCNVFNLSSFIDPFGNVYLCTIFDRKLGNLRENDFDLKKILTSEKTKKIREEIIKKKCPLCWTPCEAHQMILSNWLKL
jgi:radical SAM protein with 4Fe4S-binding SPASM domain